MWVAGVIVYRDRAYVPTNVQVDGGLYLASHPMFEADLTPDELARALNEARQLGIRNVSDQEVIGQEDPNLEATGARNWKQLGRMGGSYGIAWGKEQVDVYMSAVNRRDRFTSDPSETRRFPADTPMHVIAEAILSHWQSYREKLVSKG